MSTLTLLVPQRIKFISLFIFSFLVLILATDSNADEKMFSLKIGPMWPTAITTSWDGELMYGALVDQKVGFGVAVDFLWNSNSLDSVGVLGTHKTIRNESSYMFPIMGFIAFDPLPRAMVHPMFTMKIGYNSMVYSRSPDSSIPAAGYYYGLIIKLGVDGLYNIGERSAVFAGLEYQWADTRNVADGLGRFYRRDMSGIGLRMGFRFLL